MDLEEHSVPNSSVLGVALINHSQCLALSWPFQLTN